MRLVLAAVVPLLSAPPVLARDLMDADEQIARARALEHRFDAAATYAAWERVIDSCAVNGAQLQLAGSRLRALAPLVPPNTDPSQANAWTAKAFIFRTFDYTWTPKGSDTEKHVHVTMGDDEIGLLVEGFEAFTDLAFEYSRGALRVDYEIEVIDEPLTSMSGGDPFWLGPWDVAELIDRRYEPGALDSVFAYVKMGDSEENRAPPAMFGGTYGGDLGPSGAGWTAIMWMPGWMKGDGEVELHEWLHQVDWAFSERLHYLPQIVPTSDGGRMHGQEGGDPCYRRTPDEKNWLRFYRHIMRDHITSRMWSETRCRPWEGIEFAREWLVLGPHPYQGSLRDALAEPLWDPAEVPSVGDEAHGLTWTRHESVSEYVDLERLWPNDSVLVCASAVLVSSTERDATLWLGYDDSMVAYVNGQEVFRFIGETPPRADEASAPIHLRSGENSVMLTIGEVGGGWGFYARVGDEDGRPIDGVRWTLPR